MTKINFLMIQKNKKQKAISEEFRKIVKEEGLSKYKTNSIWVVYDDFKSSVKREVINNIPNRGMI